MCYSPLITFCLSTAYLGVSLSHFFVRLRHRFIELVPSYVKYRMDADVVDMANAIVLLSVRLLFFSKGEPGSHGPTQFLLTDAIVLWRGTEPLFFPSYSFLIDSQLQ